MQTSKRAHVLNIERSCLRAAVPSNNDKLVTHTVPLKTTRTAELNIKRILKIINKLVKKY